ncbi:hypothetical protein BJY01DRAFT_9971 [Aspergillus pseudoustus]|uniref:Uncharacterized protein n=1 Tax=Aspergillus pseudoustus TaxID=1810923 RepID=A0ABR4KSM3_9EURO
MNFFGFAVMGDLAFEKSCRYPQRHLRCTQSDGLAEMLPLYRIGRCVTWLLIIWDPRPHLPYRHRYILAYHPGKQRLLHEYLDRFRELTDGEEPPHWIWGAGLLKQLCQ